MTGADMQVLIAFACAIGVWEPIELYICQRKSDWEKRLAWPKPRTFVAQEDKP